uniref:(northern house mosquito) hypothetical protein n=1 Tax=Culex pipiens TaxID=7175 RepID=A0A8D8IER6_CULPI
MAAPPPADGGSTGFYVYVGNVPKTASEDQLRRFFGECRGIVAFSFRLEDCTYCPTKIAFIKFANRDDQERAYGLNQQFFQGKRVFVASVDSEANFTPKFSVMVKNLNEYITEEDIYEHFKHIGTIECVQKPANNYGYVSFDRCESTQRALILKNRNLKGVDIEIQQVRRNICILLEKPTGPQFGSIREKCEELGLRYEPESESETKLLVTNIPRQVQEADILEYFGRFGKIVDWQMQKSVISVLTNSACVTYSDAKTARRVFLGEPHFFQGVCLDVYNPRITYGELQSTTAVLLKRTNVFLTNDEIYQAMNECGRVSYIHRVDSTRFCTIVRFRFAIAVSQAMRLKQIAGENVSVVRYTEPNYLTDTAPIPEAFPKSGVRMQKEEVLRRLIEQEERVELSRLQTVPNEAYANPDGKFYRNEVQIMNYPIGTTLGQFRDYFRKHGTVINLREFIQGDCIGVAIVSFDTRLEARRACSMNQNFMNGKRLLLHMADEKLFLDPELCVGVMGLTTATTDEHVYDRFSEIGAVKFVLRETSGRAVVCMEHRRWLDAAMRIILVGKCRVQVSRLFVGPGPGNPNVPNNQFPPRQNGPQPPPQGNGWMPGSQGVMPRPNMMPRGPAPRQVVPSRPNLRQVEIMHGNVRPPLLGQGPPMRPQFGNNGPMMGPNGPPMMQGPMGPGPMMQGGPRMMGPNGPPMMQGGPMCPNGPPMMGPNGPPMRQGGPMRPNGPGPMMQGGPGPGPGPMMQGGPGPGPGPMMQGGPGPGPGPMMQGGPMRPPGPMGMGPNGPGPMGPNGPPMPVVTQSMRRLMQIVEVQMNGILAFSQMPMIEQFNLVHGIVNQFINFPQFVGLSADAKISYLISGVNGFNYANSFTLFTYPQQQKMISIIQADFLKTVSAPSVVPPNEAPGPEQPNPSQENLESIIDNDGVLAPWQTMKKTKVVIANEKKSPISEEISAQDRFEEAERLRNASEPAEEDQIQETLSVSSGSDSIPPAPAPPIIDLAKSRSRSKSPMTLPTQYCRVARRRKSRSPRRKSRHRSRSPRGRRSRSPVRARRRSPSPRSRRKLSPISRALESRPISHSSRRRRSLSKSPRRYTRDRSPARRRSHRRDSPPARRVRRSRTRSPRPHRRHISPPARRSSPARRHSPIRRPSPVRRRSPSIVRSKSRSHSLSPMWDEEVALDEMSLDDFTHERSASLSLSPISDRGSPFDEDIADDRGHSEPIGSTNDRTLFVNNLPYDTTDADLEELFGKYGEVVSHRFVEHPQNFETKRAYVTFDTLDQAVRGLDLHLKRHRQLLLRVAFVNKRQMWRAGFAVNVTVAKDYDELPIYETFKMCGEITCLWTRLFNSKKYCVIDFKHRDAVPIALEVRQLHNGWKCRVTAII